MSFPPGKPFQGWESSATVHEVNLPQRMLTVAFAGGARAAAKGARDGCHPVRGTMPLPPNHWCATHGFKAVCVWNAFRIQAMQHALSLSECERVSDHIFSQGGKKFSSTEETERALNARVPTTLQAQLIDGVASLPPLNDSQAQAVQHALRPEPPLLLVQGPPGTGKTATSCMIIFQMCSLNQPGGGGQETEPAALSPHLHEYREWRDSQHTGETNKVKRARWLALTEQTTGKSKSKSKPKKKGGPESNCKVLVTAPSNVAVNNLAEKIHATGLNVVRIFSNNKEAADRGSTAAQHLCLDYLTTAPSSKDDMVTRKRKLELARLLDEGSSCSKGGLALGRDALKQHRRCKQLTKLLHKKLLRDADVVCTTCVGAHTYLLDGLEFSAVLVDEATQATEPEVLIPIMKASSSLGEGSDLRKIILVGDQHQLGPVVVSQEAAKNGLARSLFERLILQGHPLSCLNVQYRMHPCLAKFSAKTFYADGAGLLTGVTAAQRACTLSFTVPGAGRASFPWPAVAGGCGAGGPGARSPQMFYSVAGVEEDAPAGAGAGMSFRNRLEAVKVSKVVCTLLACGVAPDSIGIVTPYEGQRACVEAVLASPSVRVAGVEVASVDAFQGQ